MPAPHRHALHARKIILIDVIPEDGVGELQASRVHRITVIEGELRQLCLPARWSGFDTIRLRSV
jgi:hypothetical protein